MSHSAQHLVANHLRPLGPGKLGRQLWRTIAHSAFWVAVILALPLASALAQLDTSFFQFDGNAQKAGSPGDDWDALFPTNSSATALAVTFSVDGSNPPTDTSYFTGGGSKDNNNLNQWRHTISDQAPDKDEITNAYAAAYKNSAGELLFAFGADRFDNNGSAQIGFWFFQDRVNLNANGTFSGLHRVGDLLILSDFTQGGKISNIKAYEWVGSGGSDGPVNLIFSGIDCVPGPVVNEVCATVNSAAKTAPWTFTPKSGPSGTFPTGTFFEGGINITKFWQAFGGSPACFSSFLAETRSSASVGAQLKDFALASFNLCEARVTLTPVNSAQPVNGVQTYTALVEKRDASTGFAFAPAVGASVNLGLTNTLGATAAFVGPNTCVTNSLGVCAVSVSSPTPGLNTATATATLTMNGQNLTRASNTVNTRWVQAQLTLTPAQSAHPVGESQTLTATLQFNYGNGAGFVAAPAGQTITFTASAPAAPSVGSCVTSASGECSFTVSASEAGLSNIAANWAGAISTPQGSASTAASAEAVVRWAQAALTLDPAEAASQVGNDHVLTATLTVDGLPAAGQTIHFAITSLLNNTDIAGPGG